MPHLKDHTDPMRRVINAYELNTGRALAPVLCCSTGTALRRIETPEDLTLRELRMLASRGHIPIEDIRGAI